MRDKSSLRKELLQKRDNIPPEVRRTKNRLIQANLEALYEIKNAGTVLLFASFRSEVDMTGMIRSALAAAKRVILPKVDVATQTLQLFSITGLEDLSPGYMGIPEPVPHFGKGGEGGFSEGMSVDINAIDAVIIPGACYDEKGNRVGYGGGYYDRLLSGIQKTVPLIAPAYEEQIVEAIRAEPHDIRVSVIVTDRRVIRCGV